MASNWIVSGHPQSRLAQHIVTNPPQPLRASLLDPSGAVSVTIMGIPKDEPLSEYYNLERAE
jgi:hypothetical protein